MQIIFMRHGQAEGLYTKDYERQLTNFGEIQAQHAALQILENYTPDLYIVSPFIRARQTLQVFTDITPNVATCVLPAITPDGIPAEGIVDISKTIEQYNKDHQLTVQCVLVVCHMPIVASMVSILSGQRPKSYQLAEVRVLTFENVSHIAEFLGTHTAEFVPMQP